MLTLTASPKIFVYTAAADMRKGVDALSGIVRSELSADPTDGSLFVFINGRRDRLKMLYFDGAGYWLYYRVLEAGTFEALQSAGPSRCITLDTTQLAMLLSGVSLVAAQHRRKRYARTTCAQAT